jgi:DNA-binding winged helix-turn-helix (wHTH) protein
MKQISKFITFFLMGFTAISILCYHTYDQTRQTLRTKFSGAFDKAITLDMDQRTNETKMIFYSYPGSIAEIEEPSSGGNTDTTSSSGKDDLFIVETGEGKPTVYEKTDRHKTLTEEEKVNNIKQTYLLKQNPVRVSLLDSLFRTELEKVGIVAPTQVLYTNNHTHVTQHNDVADGHSGTSFYATAYATEKRMLGILDDISLQGFVKVEPMTVFRYAPLPFILLLAGGITIVGMLYVLIFRKRKTSVFPEATESVEDVPATLAAPFQLDAIEQTLIYPGGRVPLTSDMFRLLDYLWNCENHHAFYKDLSLFLYGDNVDMETGKKRIMQIVKYLRRRIKNIPVNIENVAQKGYRIRLTENPRKPPKSPKVKGTLETAATIFESLNL